MPRERIRPPLEPGSEGSASARLSVERARGRVIYAHRGLVSEMSWRMRWLRTSRRAPPGVSLRARRWRLLSGSLLLSLLALEILLRVHELVAASEGQPLDVLLERSAAVAPAAGVRARSLRGLVRASADADVVYELKPGLEAVFKGRPLRVNALGLRGGDVTEAKPPGTLRIVGLGDSVMFGWGVAEEETYLALLRECANRGGAARPPVEVLNFAVPGYNTWMEVAAFRRKAVRFAPDLVILHMTGNDLDLPGFMLEQPPAGGWERLAIVRYARRAFGFLDKAPPLLSPPEVRRLAAGRGPAIEGRYARMVGKQAVAQALERLATTIAGLGDLPILVLVLAEEREPDRFFAGEARRHGFRVVTLGDAFSDALEERGAEATAASWRETFWLSARDSHPNVLGHAVIAERLRRAIAELWGEERVCDGIPSTATIPAC